ncbi:phage tail tape measure protein [Salmonella enterica]|nr:phage tail tape measure protein [Salmonella enterica]
MIVPPQAESQYTVLQEAASRRQLSAQEKSLLAHKDETLEYKRQLAELGDKIAHQERLNDLEKKAGDFAEQQRAKRAAIDAKSRGLTDRQAQRESTEQRIREAYGDNPHAMQNVLAEQNKTWASEDQLSGNWMAGMKAGWSQWAEDAVRSFDAVKSAAVSTFDGVAQNMASMLTGSETNWRGFTRSVLSMLTQIFMKQALVGMAGKLAGGLGSVFGGGYSGSTGTAISSFASKLMFDTGGFTGFGGKYEPAGIVHRGEFVFTKEATSRIGVDNLYRMMRGYADGGYVGAPGSPASGMNSGEKSRFEQHNHVTIQNDGANGNIGPGALKAVYDIASKATMDILNKQGRDGGMLNGGRR